MQLSLNKINALENNYFFNFKNNAPDFGLLDNQESFIPINFSNKRKNNNGIKENTIKQPKKMRKIKKHSKPKSQKIKNPNIFSDKLKNKASIENKSVKTLIMILDTNILMNEFDYIEKHFVNIKNNQIICIPYSTILELDKLKSDKKLKQTALKVIYWIDCQISTGVSLNKPLFNNILFCNSLFIQNPNQTLSSEQKNLLKLPEAKDSSQESDTQFLSCSLYLKLNFPQFDIVFFSNNKNLIQKTRKFKILSFSSVKNYFF